MATHTAHPASFPALSKSASGLVADIPTTCTSLAFSDKILLTISQAGALAHWVHVPLATDSTDPMNPGVFHNHDTTNDLLPMTHLTATTVLGGTKRDDEIVGQTLATTIGSAILMKQPQEERMLVLGMGLKGASGMGRTHFDEVVAELPEAGTRLVESETRRQLLEFTLKMQSTKHTIHLPGHTTPSPIHLTTDVGNPRVGSPKDASLTVLSVVIVAQIPLHMIVGPQYSVNTDCDAVQQYLESVLLANRGSPQAWWQTAQPESPLGILASVGSDTGSDSPRITELLFVASKIQPKQPQRLPTPPSSSPPEHGDTAGNSQSALQVRAIAISSDLLHAAEAPSPPLSPASDDADILPAIFLRDPFPAPAEIIHEPSIKKRRTATSTLDEATERRKAVRRQGGESISAAAALQSDAPPPFTHRRSTSNSGPVPLQTRPLSSSPSVASRPSSVRGPTPAEPARRSTLNRVESTTALPTDEEALLAKNKDVIARIVMAGMRLHGLSQSKRKSSKHRPSLPDTHSPNPDVSAEDPEAEKRQDEEYKAVYHHVHKSVCFTFRAHVRVASLQPHTEALRDTVDMLLGVFCVDPLAEGLGGREDRLTPGGRKAFRSARGEEGGPFVGG